MITDYAGRTILEDAEIYAGAPATYYIGSDSYAETVANVVRFQSGARKGQIKEITIRDGREIFRSTIERDGSTSYLLVSEGKKVWYGRLVVGYAHDHRDLSF